MASAEEQQASMPTTDSGETIGVDHRSDDHEVDSDSDGDDVDPDIENKANELREAYGLSGHGTDEIVDEIQSSFNTAAKPRRGGIPAYDGTTNSKEFRQEPMAIVGLACRLPDECSTPRAFWKFLERGGIAKADPPSSRFNKDAFYDASLRNKTMASPGAYFLQNVDPQDLDAQFFKLSRIEGISMDPQQRQVLEIVYEGLENAGITMEQIDNRPIGCFVGAFTCDWQDVQSRDPADRAPGAILGTGRTLLSNRISHFLNIKGPSMTIDTACSGSLTGLDVACRYLQSGEIDGAIVAGVSLYLSPEHVFDHHFGGSGTFSLTGKCHTFDEKADGYMKAEAVNMVYLKRLDDAIRDRDPIRGIIRGSATGSDGYTPGIAHPNNIAQSAAIRQAYKNAGISDLSQTSYMEFHGTGTKAGDAMEANGVADVFGPFRTPDNPLHVGSCKSNIGHSEPAAGISGLLKVVLAMEHGVIPGNPTFVTPTPKINFEDLKIRPSRAATEWPTMPFRRAGVNSFGYGGSNAHAIIDAADGHTNHVSSYKVDSPTVVRNRLERQKLHYDEEQRIEDQQKANIEKQVNGTKDTNGNVPIHSNKQESKDKTKGVVNEVVSPEGSAKFQRDESVTNGQSHVHGAGHSTNGEKPTTEQQEFPQTNGTDNPHETSEHGEVSGVENLQTNGLETNAKHVNGTNANLPAESGLENALESPSTIETPQNGIDSTENAQPQKTRKQVEELGRPYLLVFSANDEESLSQHLNILDKHLSKENVSVDLRDLMYTLSEKRSRHFHRGYSIVSSPLFEPEAVVRKDIGSDEPKISLIFTGQGAQWVEMAKDLVSTYQVALQEIEYLDEVLRSLVDPPKWTLLEELTKQQDASHLKSPDISQPLVTAFQLALLAVLQSNKVQYQSVVGHSSGEIAAAVAGGFISREAAIKIAFYRGQATSSLEYEAPVGMLAVGLGAEAVKPYLDGTSAEIACLNSPESVTLSGKRSELEDVQALLQTSGHFARFLQVNAAYHSKYMNMAAGPYLKLLNTHVEWTTPNQERKLMFSSATGVLIEGDLGADYWVKNMTSPVLFDDALRLCLSGEGGPDLLVEIGPSNALSGPIGQIKKGNASTVDYVSAWKRGAQPLEAILELAGKLFIEGCDIDIAGFNQGAGDQLPRTIIDLPNYSWNHSKKYWYENESSQDWRLRKFLHHDILGNKVLGTPWAQPTFKNIIRTYEHPWLRDHRLGGNNILPASAFIAMAVEALFQKSKATGRLADDIEIHQASYQLRDVAFVRILPLNDPENDGKATLTLAPCSSFRDSWHEFKITSTVKGVTNIHCQGQITLIDLESETATCEQMRPLEHSTPAAPWYKAMREVGYMFGPHFQKQKEVEFTAGRRENRAVISFEEPESKTPQSTYPLHPACLDSCIQAAAASLWSGHRSALTSLLLPALIDEATIPAQNARPKTGMALANAEYRGVGRLDDSKQYKSHIVVFNQDNNELIFKMRGLHYHALDVTTAKLSRQTYMQVAWKPDISLMSTDQLSHLLSDVVPSHPLASQSEKKLEKQSDSQLNGIKPDTHVSESVGETITTNGIETSESALKLDETFAVAAISRMIDLVEHKKPDFRLLEVSFVDSPDSLWLDHVKPCTTGAMLHCYFQLLIASANDSRTKEAIEKYDENKQNEFNTAPPDAVFKELKEASLYDVVLVKVPHPNNQIQDAIDQAYKALRQGGFLFVIQQSSATPAEDEVGTAISVFDKSPAGCDMLQLPGRIPPDAAQLVYAGRCRAREQPNSGSDKTIHVVHFHARSESKSETTKRLLESGWRVEEHDLQSISIPEAAHVLVLDEIDVPVLSTITNEQFTAIHQLVEKKPRILWVTSGAQMAVTKPEHSLVVGFARTLMSEDPEVSIMTLDLETSASASFRAIVDALETLFTADVIAEVDHELVERAGIVHISRLMIDDVMNQTEKNETQGPALVEKPLHDNPADIRLVNPRVGSIDTLEYAEIPLGDLDPEWIEVEVHAAAMNFKDFAHTMGLIPCNETLLGLECAGIVTKVGSKVESFQVGDRVAGFRKDGGTFANRVHLPYQGCQKIPENMTFEDASTVGICYLTAAYGLFTLANLKKGQSILIHVAAGGVGLAAVQLAKYLETEIYVTVGSDEKRKFLKDEFEIQEDHMFTSRSAQFAPDLMKATRGRGVDVILNSLAGDLLRESWRCIAAEGTFIEIGKRDLLERGTLSLEPFTRNASYRAFDLSAPSMTPDIFQSLMDRVSQLTEKKHLKTLHIGKRVSFTQPIEAFRAIGDGKHIGKIVLTDEDRSSVRVHVRPAIRKQELRPDVTYLLVGGLKGICGSLATFLSRSGAKYLAVISRSGYDDKFSQLVLYHLRAMGTHIDLIQGDVTNIDDVERAFRSTTMPVGGIVNGAMVLRDKLFADMTAQEFRETLAAKVQGTWNLHNVALQQGLSLDFFTLLASVSGVFGNKAQCNYAAANVFLDSFAAYRHGLGLPACSIDLGHIEDVGYLAFEDREQISRRMELAGFKPINEALLHKIMQFSVMQQSREPINPSSSTQMITGFPYPLFASSPVKPHHRYSFLQVSAAVAAAGGANAEDIHLAILKNARQAGTDEATVRASAIEVCNAVLMKGLGMDEKVDPSRPLSSYGIDSLVAVEIRNWARSELDIEISTLEILGSKTLKELGEILVKRLLY